MLFRSIVGVVDIIVAVVTAVTSIRSVVNIAAAAWCLPPAPAAAPSEAGASSPRNIYACPTVDELL